MYTEPLQRFETDPTAAETQIRERETGRCISVQDCKVGGTTIGHVRVDRCGAGSCGGRNSLWAPLKVAGKPQTWAFKSKAGSGGPDMLNSPGELADPLGQRHPLSQNFSHPAAMRSSQWRCVVPVAGFNVVVWTDTQGDPSVETSNQWTLTESGQIRAGRAPPDLPPAQTCGDNCCLQAEACVAPCVPPRTWGETFLLSVFGCLVAYLAAGVGHSSWRGRSFGRDGWRRMLPHVELWAQVRLMSMSGRCICLLELFFTMLSKYSLCEAL